MRALLTILVTIAAAAVVWLWFAGGAVPVPSARDADVPAAVASTATTSPAPDAVAWQRVQRSLDDIAARLSAIEERLASAAIAPVSKDAANGRVDAAPAVFFDPQQLRRALDEVEQQRLREKYAGVSDADLLAEVQRLQWKNNDPLAAGAALQLLLARDLDPARRGEALTQLGMLQRDRNDVDAAEHTLRGVVDEFGMNGDIGSQAAYQLAWTLGKRDPAAALSVADSLARQAGNANMRTRARWTAARFAESSGDVARARADYRALLVEVADRKELFDVVKDVRYRLELLDGR